MTDAQFEKYLALQAAQLAMLQGIFSNLGVIASGTGKQLMYNWNDVEKLIKNGQALVDKL